MIDLNGPRLTLRELCSTPRALRKNGLSLVVRRRSAAVGKDVQMPTDACVSVCVAQLSNPGWLHLDSRLVKCSSTPCCYSTSTC